MTAKKFSYNEALAHRNATLKRRQNDPKFDAAMQEALRKNVRPLLDYLRGDPDPRFAKLADLIEGSSKKGRGNPHLHLKFDEADEVKKLIVSVADKLRQTAIRNGERLREPLNNLSNVAH